MFDLPLPTPAERGALARAIAEIEAAGRGAPVAAIDIAIGKLALAFPPVKQSEAAATARLALYREALADLPADILAEAVAACIRRCRFFPTVAEIREGARGPLALREWQLGRLRMLAWRHDREFRGEKQ
ncbi:hypothetical protein [Sphingomonas sanxanigenens]|uniref:hypothetical protein n=1 Tax=Sphingomonas sanxanigenens TaxID=397260 RepID=UPI0004B5C0FA|nr:hypothetical protein [Sphingomonas sanxanigenens]